MSMTMQLILYGVLIAVMGVVGYYVGKNITSVGSTKGVIGGLVIGAVVSGAIYYTQGSNEEGEVFLG